MAACGARLCQWRIVLRTWMLAPMRPVIHRSAGQCRGDLFEVSHRPGGDGSDVLRDDLDRPIPPGKVHQGPDLILGEAISNVCCGVPADDGVVRNFFGNHRSCRDNRTVTDVHSGHDGGVSADPDVVADHGVAT